MRWHFIFEHYLAPADRVFENKNKNPWEKPGTGPKHLETLLEHPRNTPGTPSEHPAFPGIPPWLARPSPKRMAHEGFTIFSINIFYPNWCLPCSRVSLIKFTSLYSCLVFFDFDILSLIKKKKYFFALVFHIDFSGNLWFPKFIIALDFSNGVFDFQNEIDMDLTHVTASLQ